MATRVNAAVALAEVLNNTAQVMYDLEQEAGEYLDTFIAPIEALAGEVLNSTHATAGQGKARVKRSAVMTGLLRKLDETRSLAWTTTLRTWEAYVSYSVTGALSMAAEAHANDGKILLVGEGGAGVWQLLNHEEWRDCLLMSAIAMHPLMVSDQSLDQNPGRAAFKKAWAEYATFAIDMESVLVCAMCGKLSA